MNDLRIQISTKPIDLPFACKAEVDGVTVYGAGKYYTWKDTEYFEAYFPHDDTLNPQWRIAFSLDDGKELGVCTTISVKSGEQSAYLKEHGLPDQIAKVVCLHVERLVQGYQESVDKIFRGVK